MAKTKTPFAITATPLFDFEAQKIYKKLYTNFTVVMPAGYKVVSVKVEKKKNQVVIKVQPI